MNLFLKILQYSHGTIVLESLFNKVAGNQVCNFINKRLQHRCFPVIIAKFLRIPILRTSANGCFCLKYASREFLSL